ncbi:hypothetical protein BS78_10G039800 [Paspalum vaginatum]|nr:hypothetical protein BS78_10G039800 [Paspalum vaginatum]
MGQRGPNQGKRKKGGGGVGGRRAPIHLGGREDFRTTPAATRALAIARLPSLSDVFCSSQAFQQCDGFWRRWAGVGAVKNAYGDHLNSASFGVTSVAHDG